MQIVIHGYRNKEHVAQVNGEVSFDELREIVESPKEYLFGIHPDAKARGVDRVLIEVNSPPVDQVA